MQFIELQHARKKKFHSFHSVTLIKDIKTYLHHCKIIYNEVVLLVHIAYLQFIFRVRLYN